jgi:hypothetical protein
MLKLQLSSVAAWQVTTVVPMLKKAPEVELQVTGLQTDPEVDGAENVTFAPLWPLAALTTMSAEQPSVQAAGVLLVPVIKMSPEAVLSVLFGSPVSLETCAE